MSGSPSLPDQISVSLFQCGQQNRTGRRRPAPALRGPHSQACPPSCATARQGWDLETACPEHTAACSSCEHEQVSKEENQRSRHAKAHTQTWDGGSSGRGVLSVPIWALPWEVWVSRPRKVAREGTGLSADPAQDRDSLRGQSLDLRAACDGHCGSGCGCGDVMCPEPPRAVCARTRAGRIGTWLWMCWRVGAGRSSVPVGGTVTPEGHDCLPCPYTSGCRAAHKSINVVPELGP